MKCVILVIKFCKLLIRMLGSRYAVFRGANKQKHMFKQDPKVLIWGQPVKVIGGRLLVSGFW